MTLKDDRPGPGARPVHSLTSDVLSAVRAAGLATASDAKREFEFTAADFDRIKRLIHEHAGIVLSPTKQDMVYGRLARRLRDRRLRNFAEYLDRLSGDRMEWEAFVNALTTNLTSFFREVHHFDILTERLKKPGIDRPYQIWCCAASTGEEAYSLAMTACEAFATLSPPVRIVATDINTTVLADARRGVYGEDRVVGLKPGYLKKYFVPDSGGTYRVKAELQRLITFSRLNLLETGWSVKGPLDAIFCRNVMIYFDKRTQYDILKRFVPLLKPDGALFAGHSESFLHAADLFKPLGRTVYQRADVAGKA